MRIYNVDFFSKGNPPAAAGLCQLQTDGHLDNLDRQNEWEGMVLLSQRVCLSFSHIQSGIRCGEMSLKNAVTIRFQALEIGHLMPGHQSLTSQDLI